MNRDKPEEVESMLIEESRIGKTSEEISLQGTIPESRKASLSLVEEMVI